LKFKKGTT